MAVRSSGAKISGEEFGPGGGRDHGGVVGGQGEGGEGDGERALVGFGGEAAAELGVGGDSAGDEDGAGAEVLGRGKGLLEEVADDGVLEAGEEVEGLWVEGPVGDEASDVIGGRAEGVGDGAASFDGGLHAVGLRVAEDGGLDAAEGEVEVRAGGGIRVAVLDRREGEGDGAWVAVRSEAVDPGAAGVAETEELGDLVEGFAGGVVDGAADVAVVPGASLPCLSGEVEVGVAAGDDEGEERFAGLLGGEE